MIPTRIRVVLAVALLASLAAGCRDKAPQGPKISEVFPNLPLPPEARFISKSGGAEALQITVMSPRKRSDIETYYRSALTRDGWKLVNQAKDPEGALVLLAEQDGPPLWVRIHSADDSAATYVEFSGAKIARAKPAS
jgi:hypothetical protein